METTSVKCATITLDPMLRDELTAATAQIQGVEMARGLQTFPSPESLSLFFQSSPARIVFLDVRAGAAALRVASETELIDPGVQFIAIGRPEAADDAPWRGIQESLTLPLDAVALRDAVSRRMQVLSKLPWRYQRRPTQFMSFLPAKAGAGASTLAVGLAHVISAGQRTLLCDFDLASGVVGFRHRLTEGHSLSDVLAKASYLDESLWSQSVSKVDQLDVLPSSLTPGAQFSETALEEVFNFLRGTYDVVIFDHSGNLEDYSIRVMKACSRVFLVTTQELESLHVGRAKIGILERAGLQERVGILLNRMDKTHLLKPADVEDLLKHPIQAQFPNEYKLTQQSIQEGGSLKPNSALSKALQNFVPQLVEEWVPQPKQPRRFIEYVRLSALPYWRQNEMRSEKWT